MNVNKNKAYPLVIFDWDGTLVDSIARIVLCLQKTIQKLGYEHRSPEQLRGIIGLGLNHAILSLYPNLIDKDVDNFANQYRQFFVNTNSSSLFNSVDTMLSQLKDKGVMLAIATGKGRSGLDNALAEVGLEQFFHATRCADETQSKPNPAMLIEILDEFGLEAKDAIMIGDSSYDIQMAQQIKMDNIGVTYGVHTKEDLQALNTQIIFDEVGSLAQYLLAQTRRF